MVYTFYSRTGCCTDVPFIFQFFLCWITWKKIQIMHSLNQPNTGKAQILNTFTILVLTISIRKRIFCLLLASLKKSLEWREFCRKGIHGKSWLICLIHMCWMKCKHTWIHGNCSSLITIFYVWEFISSQIVLWLIKFNKYFRTYPFKLKVKQKNQKLLQKYYIYNIASSQSAITGSGRSSLRHI